MPADTTDFTSKPRLNPEQRLKARTTDAQVIGGLTILGVVIVSPAVLLLAGKTIPTELWTGWATAIGAVATCLVSRARETQAA
jgi:hypothetical protein